MLGPTGKWNTELALQKNIRDNIRLKYSVEQNILLEAKIQTLKNDFEKERNELLEEIANLKGDQ